MADETTLVHREYGEAFARQDGAAVIDLYVYRDSKMLVPTTRAAHTFKFSDDAVAGLDAGYRREASFVRWTPGRNALFVHSSHNGAALGVLKALGFQRAGEEADRG